MRALRLAIRALRALRLPDVLLVAGVLAISSGIWISLGPGPALVIAGIALVLMALGAEVRGGR